MTAAGLERVVAIAERLLTEPGSPLPAYSQPERLNMRCSATQMSSTASSTAG